MVQPGLPRLTPVTGESTSIGLFGWSKGFVAFSADGGPSSGTGRAVTLSATASRDGAHWTPTRPIDLTGFADQVTVVSVVEGPAGLLAVGHNPMDTCGGPPAVAALWRSADGIAWKRVTGPKLLVDAPPDR
ncbi:MAG: hypothetical protein H0V73_02300 [Chloroflexi bacterium]|nr:hypothetical protein [Chloroflexota bacterium]